MALTCDGVAEQAAADVLHHLRGGAALSVHQLVVSDDASRTDHAHPRPAHADGWGAHRGYTQRRHVQGHCKDTTSTHSTSYLLNIN